MAHLLGDHHKALLGDAPHAVLAQKLLKCLREPQAYTSKGLTVGVGAAPLTARVARPPTGVWASFFERFQHEVLPTGMEALGENRVVTHGDLIVALAAAIAPQLSARGGVRAQVGGAAAAAAAKKRRSSTGTGAGGAGSSASAVQSTAPPRLPQASFREPLLAFCAEEEAKHTDIFASPRGLQTLLFAALVKSGAMEVSGIFRRSVSLERVVALLRSFASGGEGASSGPTATTAQVDYIVQLLVRFSHRTAHARPPTQTNSPRPPPPHATKLPPITRRTVGKRHGRRQRDL